MWEKIKDCGKQLNINFRVSQTVTGVDEYITEYKIEEINIDEYSLHLVNKLKNGIEVTADTLETIVFTCEKIIKFHFEVWVEKALPV